MKKKEQHFLDVQSSRQKARNNTRQPGTAELWQKPLLSVLDATFGCYQLDCPQTNIACWNSIHLLGKSARTVSREFYLKKRVYILGLFHMVSWGCCDNTLLCKTCLHAVLFTISLRGLKHCTFCIAWKITTWKGISKPCVHWMDCACLFHKMCGYYNKGVYVQLVRSTTRGYFWGR